VVRPGDRSGRAFMKEWFSIEDAPRRNVDFEVVVKDTGFEGLASYLINQGGVRCSCLSTLNRSSSS